MMFWPVVALVGFLVLTAFVIAMGTRSTARYELEQQGAARAPRPLEGAARAARPLAAEPVGAVSV